MVSVIFEKRNFNKFFNTMLNKKTISTMKYKRSTLYYQFLTLDLFYLFLVKKFYHLVRINSRCYLSHLRFYKRPSKSCCFFQIKILINKKSPQISLSTSSPNSTPPNSSITQMPSHRSRCSKYIASLRY